MLWNPLWGGPCAQLEDESTRPLRLPKPTQLVPVIRNPYRIRPGGPKREVLRWIYVSKRFGNSTIKPNAWGDSSGKENDCKKTYHTLVCSFVNNWIFLCKNYNTQNMSTYPTINRIFWDVVVLFAWVTKIWFLLPDVKRLTTRDQKWNGLSAIKNLTHR